MQNCGALRIFANFKGKQFDFSLFHRWLISHRTCMWREKKLLLLTKRSLSLPVFLGYNVKIILVLNSVTIWENLFQNMGDFLSIEKKNSWGEICRCFKKILIFFYYEKIFIFFLTTEWIHNGILSILIWILVTDLSANLKSIISLQDICIKDIMRIHILFYLN